MSRGSKPVRHKNETRRVLRGVQSAIADNPRRNRAHRDTLRRHRRTRTCPQAENRTGIPEEDRPPRQSSRKQDSATHSFPLSPPWLRWPYRAKSPNRHQCDRPSPTSVHYKPAARMSFRDLCTDMICAKRTGSMVFYWGRFKTGKPHPRGPAPGRLIPRNSAFCLPRTDCRLGRPERLWPETPPPPGA